MPARTGRCEIISDDEGGGARDGDGRMAGLGDIVAELAWAYRDAAAGFERAVGMSRARVGALSELARRDELSQADLQQALGLDRSSITRIVKALEADGLVRRRPDPRDNRFTLVTLTEAGHAIVDDLDAKGRAFQAQNLAEVTADEADTLRRYLRRIRVAARRTGDHTIARSAPQ